MKVGNLVKVIKHNKRSHYLKVGSVARVIGIKYGKENVPMYYEVIGEDYYGGRNITQFLQRSELRMIRKVTVKEKIISCIGKINKITDIAKLCNTSVPYTSMVISQHKFKLIKDG